jgi:hypothetical protein
MVEVFNKVFETFRAHVNLGEFTVLLPLLTGLPATSSCFMPYCNSGVIPFPILYIRCFLNIYRCLLLEGIFEMELFWDYVDLQGILLYTGDNCRRELHLIKFIWLTRNVLSDL